MDNHLTKLPIIFPSSLTSTLFSRIQSFIHGCKRTITLEVTIPSSIYFRTEIICEYISDTLDITFSLDDFLLLLYEQMLDQSIKQYNPSKLVKKLTLMNKYEEVLTIHNPMQNETVHRPMKVGRMTSILFTLDKQEARKGELLLSELEELYYQPFTLQNTIASLWIHTIEEYKKGHSSSFISSIIRLIKKEYLE